MELKKSEIIQPVHPNRATKLFGGKASGILNWNDLKYPHIYKLREKLRATFFSSAEITLDDKGDMDSKQFHEIVNMMNRLISETMATFALQEQIADYSTDPSVTSIFSTMLDQSHEHIHLFLRALEHYGESPKPVYVEVLHDDEVTTVEVLLKRLQRLHESKLSTLHDVSLADGLKGLHEAFARVLQDRHNHAEFLMTIHNLTIKEHKLDVQPLPPFEQFIYDDSQKESEEVSADGIDLDDFDDL